MLLYSFIKILDQIYTLDNSSTRNFYNIVNLLFFVTLPFIVILLMYINCHSTKFQIFSKEDSAFSKI